MPPHESNPVERPTHPPASPTLLPEEAEVLRAVRELHFGVVEVVIHDRRITEIRQTRKTRIPTGRGTTD